MSTLAELGYPSHEELVSIGMTREEFYLRYVNPKVGKMPPWWKFWAPVPSVELFAQNVLNAFYQDYPQIIQRRAAQIAAATEKMGQVFGGI